MPSLPPPSPTSIVPRFLAAVFGLAFAGVGIAILAYMWLSPRNEFGSPPLFFRVAASFIALPITAFGAAALFSAFTGRSMTSPGPERFQNLTTTPSPPNRAAESNYRCPHCGAPLGQGADVSPSGDVKCTFCNTWFNIHRPTA